MHIDFPEYRIPCFSFYNQHQICEAKAAYPGVPFGVAAYDVDYDSVSSDCPSMHIGSGTYRRVEALRRLNEFMETRFTDASRLQECLDLPLV
ncbi:hypothetical protein MTO96_040566 [Rhipicephalus appendiculatus]